MPQIQVPSEQSVFSQGRLDYQNIPANPNAFGAGVGQSLSNLSAGIAQGGEQVQQIVMRQAETDANQADLKLGIALNTRTFDPKSGYMTLQGQNAVDGLKQYQSDIQDTIKDVRSTLNPAAAKMFDSVATRRAMIALQQGALRFLWRAGYMGVGGCAVGGHEGHAERRHEAG